MNKQPPLFWIGIRESEINDTDNFFAGSITIFGSGKGNNYSFDKDFYYRYDYNQETNMLDEYINEKALEIIRIYPDCQFMLYYQSDVNILKNEILSRTICVNDVDLINILEDKINTRIWMSDMVPTPPYVIEYGKDISLDRACKNFPAYSQFVVQADYSCGGSGTWLFQASNSDEILKRIVPNNKYTVSPYIKDSISLNIHIVIYDTDILLLPCSVQLIALEDYNFTYKGADFITYQYLSQDIQKKVKNYALKVGEKLRQTGYRGILGIDFIANGTEVYFIEINARFQSSTFLINKALNQQYNSISVASLNQDAFSYKKPPSDFNLSIGFSFYSYQYEPEHLSQTRHIYSRASASAHVIECLDDSLDWNMKLERHTYLFKLVMDTNIAAISPEHELLLRANLSVGNLIFSPSIDWKNQLWELKIMLLNHGIHISASVNRLLLEQGGINYEEFEALDLILNKEVYISVPYLTILSELSPFEITYTGENYYLTYYGIELVPVIIRPCNTKDKRRTKNGLLFEDISYMGHDRLRIYFRNGCYYKKTDLSCKFCDIDNLDLPLPLDDIKEVIDAYLEEPDLRHYLIGGGSESPDSEMNKVLDIARYIKITTNKPIYLMTTPPNNIHVLYDLFDAGVTEVAFNLEVFDRNLAKKYMPGKGNIPLTVYDNAFRTAVNIWGKTGAVRSILIVGLEPEESLLKGIEYLCRLGVAPILSLLKPIESTPLHYMLPPSDETILHITHKARHICQKYNVKLGPSCHYCEDNSIKVSFLKEQ